MTAPFKYTITVEKAEETEDGLFIEGVASGLGVDSQGHEMDPAAIVRFEKQIAARAEAGDPVPYLDWHNNKSVLAELGHVVKATINDDWSMRIRVRLDEDNPAAVALHRKVMKGKKYGMSVKGEAVKFARVLNDAGQNVLRLFDVILTEVSNTTQPIWTPSLGTVIAKAVIDEADAESVSDGGDNPEMSDNDTAELQTGVTEGAPADENPSAEAEEVEAGAEDTTAAAESEDSEDAVEVEKAGAKYSKTAKSKFLAMYKEMGDMLRSEGILEDEEEESVEVKKAEGDEKPEAETTAQSDDEPDSAETPETPEAEASEDSDDADKGADAEPEKTDREKELEAALAEMTARAEAAEAKAKSPQMVVTPESTQTADPTAEVREALRALPREQRLAEAFRLAEAAKARR